MLRFECGPKISCIGGVGKPGKRALVARPEHLSCILCHQNMRGIMEKTKQNIVLQISDLNMHTLIHILSCTNKTINIKIRKEMGLEQWLYS